MPHPLTDLHAPARSGTQPGQCRQFEPGGVLAPGATLHGRVEGQLHLGHPAGTTTACTPSCGASTGPTTNTNPTKSCPSICKLILTQRRRPRLASSLPAARDPRYAIGSNDLTRTVTADSVEFTAGPNGRYPARPDHRLLPHRADVIGRRNALATHRHFAMDSCTRPRLTSLLYLAQTYWFVRGNIAGKPVRGFLLGGAAWMPEGGRLYIDRIRCTMPVTCPWYSWANHYATVSCEVPLSCSYGTMSRCAPNS